MCLLDIYVYSDAHHTTINQIIILAPQIENYTRQLKHMAYVIEYIIVMRACWGKMDEVE